MVDKPKRRSPYHWRDEEIKDLRTEVDKYRKMYFEEEGANSRLLMVKIQAETSLDAFKKLSSSLTAEYEGYRKAMGEVLDRLIPKKD